jgi:hypothetical protein
MPHLTTHSTGARIALFSSARLESTGGSSRPVNSGVRFLLNDRGRRLESIVLHLERLRSS